MIDRGPAISLAAAAALVLGACGGDDGRSLTLRADSTQPSYTVTYTVGDAEPVTETVDGPWSTTIDISGSFSVDLSVENPDDEGTVECEIAVVDSAAPPPAATGEAAATCTARGSVGGGRLDLASSALGTPFDESADAGGGEADGDGAEGDAADGGDADDDAPMLEGVSADVVYLVDGEPASPMQFDRGVLAVIVEGLDQFDQDADIQIAVEARIDDGVTVRNQNERERYELADLEADGRLVHTVVGAQFDTVGTFQTVVEGRVSVDGARLPFAETIDVQIDPVDVTVETQQFSGGFVTADLPSSWDVLTDDVVSPVYTSTTEPPPFDLGDFRETVGFARRGDADVALFRVIRPLTTSIDEVLDTLEASLDGRRSVAREPGQVDGRPAERIAFENDDGGGGTFDTFALGDEIFMLQTRWSSSPGVALQIRDSIALDPTQLRGMTHRRTETVDGAIIGGDGAEVATLRVEVDVPADWLPVAGPDSNVIGAEDPAGDGDVFVSIIVEEPPPTVAQLIDELAAEGSGTLSTPVELELDEVPFTRVDQPATTELGPLSFAVATVTVEGVPVGIIIEILHPEPVGTRTSVVDEILKSVEFSVVG